MEQFQYRTEFGALDDFCSGSVEIVNDNPKHYAKSNIFAVASGSAPWERVVVARNMQYVIEAMRTEGLSPWYVCAHDETILCMDGEVEIHLLKPSGSVVAADIEGAVLYEGEPEGRKMGRIILRRGHQALLPEHSLYRFQASAAGVSIIQTLLGAVSVEKWAEICQTENHAPE